MTEKRRVSIIVPVYNAENYLHECLQSIQNQTYTDFECLCVDNNSIDQSRDIIMEFVDKDERFYYLKELHQGPSAARNCGLDNARGEFIFFIDADDRVEKGYLNDYVNYAVKYDADMVIGGYTIDHGEVLNYSKAVPVIENIITGTGGVVWAKLYRATLIDKLRFNECYNLREDLLFNLAVIEKSPNVTCFPSYQYHYRQTEKSLTRASRSGLELDDGAVEEIIAKIKNSDSRYVGDFLKRIILWDAIYLLSVEKTVKRIIESTTFERNKSYIKCNSIQELLLYKPLCSGHVLLADSIFRIYKRKLEKGNKCE